MSSVNLKWWVRKIPTLHRHCPAVFGMLPSSKVVTILNIPASSSRDYLNYSYFEGHQHSVTQHKAGKDQRTWDENMIKDTAAAVGSVNNTAPWRCKPT